MTYEQKLEKALDYLVLQGNTEQEATEILAGLMCDCSMNLPQRAWYSKEYCLAKRLQKNTAIVQLRKLPYGEEIIKTEQKLCKC